MSKKKIAYIQFQTGLIAEIETSALANAAGDVADFHFINGDAAISKLNIEDYDQVIIGSSPFDYPESLTPAVKELVANIVKRNFPCLGIGFGHLVLAETFGFKVERKKELAEIREIVTMTIKNTHSDITPTMHVDLADEIDEKNFFAYVNHYETVTDGEKSQVIFSSDNNPYAGIEYTNKIYSAQCLPFLNLEHYEEWLNAYPDYWRNVTGFYEPKMLRNRKFFRNFIYRYSHMYAASNEEIQNEKQKVIDIRNSYKDLSISITILRNFINKVKKV